MANMKNTAWKFETHSRYYVHFRTYTFEKGMNSLIAMG